MIKTVSNSSVGLWLKCPKAWEFRYVKGLKIPPSGALVQGSSYHGALKENFSFKLKNGKDMSISDVLDAYDTSWNERLKGDDLGKDESEEAGGSEVDWGGRPPDMLKDEGAKLVKVYHKQYAPAIMPLGVELYREKPLIEGVKFIGYLDLELEDKIIDHKLKGKMISQIEADKDTQPLSYCFLSDKMDFDYHVAIKKKVPEIQILTVKRKTAEDIEWWKNMVIDIVNNIKTGIFPPNPTSWLCSERWCGYWPKCHASRE